LSEDFTSLAKGQREFLRFEFPGETGKDVRCKKYTNWVLPHFGELWEGGDGSNQKNTLKKKKNPSRKLTVP